MPKKTILITGATGYIGRRLKHRLLDKGSYNIRLFVRNRLKVQVAHINKVEIYEGTTFEIESLEKALISVDTAFYLIHYRRIIQERLRRE